MLQYISIAIFFQTERKKVWFRYGPKWIAFVFYTHFKSEKWFCEPIDRFFWELRFIEIQKQEKKNINVYEITDS